MMSTPLMQNELPTSLIELQMLSIAYPDLTELYTLLTKRQMCDSKFIENWIIEHWDWLVHEMDVSDLTITTYNGRDVVNFRILGLTCRIIATWSLVMELRCLQRQRTKQ